MSILLPTVPFLKHPSCLLLPRAVAFALALSPSMCIRASHAAEDNGTICLNEVRIDQPGADNDEDRKSVV